MNANIQTAQAWLKSAIDIVSQKVTLLNRGNKKVVLTATTASIGAFVAYLCLVRYYRYKNINMIRAKYPDPNVILHDSEAAKFVFTYLSTKEFPYLFRLSLELALFKTFTIPSISKILAGTNEFSGGMEQAIRRTEDTTLLLSEINEPLGRIQNQLEKSPNTPKEDINFQHQRSSDSIQRLNELHGKYPILNGDYLYTLALFVFEPISWINRFEWRQLDQREINAIFKVWYDVGKKMNIEGIPETVEEFFNFKEEYGLNHIKYHPANWKVAEPTVRILLSQLPSFLRNLVYPTALRTLPSILDSCDAEAFKLPYKESHIITKLVKANLHVRAFFIRNFMFPRNKFFIRTPFYPNKEGKYIPNHFIYQPSPYINGYKIEEFGPVKFLNKKPAADHPPTHGEVSDMARCPMMH